MNLIKTCGLCLLLSVALSGCVTAPTPPESDPQVEQAVLEASFSEAVKAMEQCPSCAIAIAVDRRCYRCKKSYEDGKIVKQTVRPN